MKKYEIERKFLLRRLPGDLMRGVNIEQGYIAVNDPEIRVRRQGYVYYLTKKQGSGIKRTETEIEITGEAFDILWPLTVNRRVKKLRFRVKAPDGLVWEVDHYGDGLNGLYTAEVEMPHESWVYVAPENITPLILADVTEDEEYKNRSLAVLGLPDSFIYYISQPR